jgi:hypothetical protein
LFWQVRDDAFLNGVQSVVNGWVKDVQRVTRLTETPFPDTVLEEVGRQLALHNLFHLSSPQAKPSFRRQPAEARPGLRLPGVLCHAAGELLAQPG